MIIPNIWENKIDVPNHQPVVFWSARKSTSPFLETAVLSNVDDLINESVSHVIFPNIFPMFHSHTRRWNWQNCGAFLPRMARPGYSWDETQGRRSISLESLILQKKTCFTMVSMGNWGFFIEKCKNSWKNNWSKGLSSSLMAQITSFPPPLFHMTQGIFLIAHLKQMLKLGENHQDWPPIPRSRSKLSCTRRRASTPSELGGWLNNQWGDWIDFCWWLNI